MKRKQQNSINMYAAVVAFFEAFPDIWNMKVAVANTFAKFSNLYTRITDTGLSQKKGSTKGYTNQKNGQKKILIDLAHGLLLKLKGYALEHKNAVLLQAIDYSVSDLEASRELDLINQCQIIHDKGLEFKTDAVNYDITDGELADLQTAIVTFKPMSIKRDNVGDKRTIDTGNIEALLKEGVPLLDLLDTQVEGLIKDEPFVAGYFQARKITDRAGRGKGKDEDDDVPPAEPEV